MDRLIVTDKQGDWHLDGAPWSSIHTGRVITPDIHGLLYNALLRLKEYEDTGLEPEEIINGRMLTGWIPVEEQLPGHDGKYLVTFKIGFMVHELGYGCCKRTMSGEPIGYGWYDLYAGEYIHNKAILAWMPLPGPYNPEEGQP